MSEIEIDEAYELGLGVYANGREPKCSYPENTALADSFWEGVSDAPMSPLAGDEYA